MNKLIFESAAILLMICAATVGPASATDDISQWGTVGAWSILIDTDAGNVCYMENTLDDDTLVQFGIAPDRNGGFFAAYNARWSGIEEGMAGIVHFDFGPTLFGGEYVGDFKDGLPGAYVFFNNPEFVKEFAKRDQVSISEKTGEALEFKLTGTMKAINAVRNCDAEQAQ